MSIRIGLLVDSRKVPVWQKAIIKFICENPRLQLCVVLVNQSNLRSGTKGRWMYRLLRKIDRTAFALKDNQFLLCDISDLVAGVDTLSVIPKHTKHKDDFQPEDINWIKERQLDILIRFGFRILTSEILHVAKHGIWSLHHGDNAVNRGGPPAFWEVVNRDPITGVTLQVLSEKLDDGKVLGKSFCKTDFTSFNRNQNNVYAAGVELFCNTLKQFANKSPEGFFFSLAKKTPAVASPTFYRDPKNVKAFIIFIYFWRRRLRETVIRFFFFEQWALCVHRNANDLFSFNESSQLTPPGNTDWADPFLFKHEGLDYLFFESLDKKSGKGVIKCVALGDKDSKPFLGLNEPYHLSYPTITEHSGKIYLMVEAAEAKSVWLYECLKFPNEWKKIKALLNNIEFYDPTLYLHEGTWYLFGTERPVAGSSRDQFLHIYFTDDLLSGEWNAHPMNPITRDVRGARPAGRFFLHQGKLIRPSQIGTPKYGYGIRLQEVIKLSAMEYEEKPFLDILPWKENMLATHTFSSVDDWFVADGQTRRFCFF